MDVDTRLSRSPVDRVVEALSAQLCAPKQRSGGQWSARCPAHDDRRKSLELGTGTDGRALVRCHAGCDIETVLDALGLTGTDLFVEPPTSGTPIEDVYPYVDEGGGLLYELVRRTAKQFHVRRPDGVGGWTYNIEGVRRVLYRLPELLLGVEGDERVWIAEGEKDADALHRAGRVATTNFGGAGKWRSQYNTAFVGADVSIVFDIDATGEAHGRQVARSLLAVANRVRVLAPAIGNDVSDHLAARRSVDDLDVVFDSQEPETDRWLERDTERAVPPSQSLDIICLADIESRPLTWLWADRIPTAKFILLEGDPGVGKSTITLDLAARISTGSCMPDDSAGLDRPRNVLLLAGEDDFADTIRPRLSAAGADCKRVFTPVEHLRLPRDLEKLRRLIEESDAALVVFDALVDYLDAGDTYKDESVRAALLPLAELAQDTGATLIGVRHLTKNAESKALYRGGGSIGFAAVARTVLQVHAHPDDLESRVLCVAKSNFARRRDTAIEFRLADSMAGSARIEWLGSSELSANDFVAPEPAVRPSAIDEAVEFLRTELADGPVPTADVSRHAGELGISFTGAIARARKQLGVRAIRETSGWALVLDETDVRENPTESAPPGDSQ